MVITGSWYNIPVAVSFKPGSTTVSLGRPESARVFSYDHSGRIWSIYKDGVSYRRGLNGQVRSKYRDQDGVAQLGWLIDEQISHLIEDACSALSEFVNSLLRGDVLLNSSLPSHGLDLLQAASVFDYTKSCRESKRFKQLYEPVGILPPDRYLSLVLQATEGCSFNTCTFCTFYKDRSFNIKSADEFARHAVAVKNFVGKGLSLRKGIFLADANALVAPMQFLLPVFEHTNAIYDVRKIGGIYSFLDGFSGEKKSVSDYDMLHELGLRRVYIGLESGDEDLLKFLHKPGKPADVLDAVRNMKEAGINVGVIILVGAGGHEYADKHVSNTLDIVGKMPLDRGDIVYLSELVIDEQMPYATAAGLASIAPFDSQALVDQTHMLKTGLRSRLGRNGPIISRYDIREFIY